MYLRFLAFLLLSLSFRALAEEPWGKDADLSFRHDSSCYLDQRAGVLSCGGQKLLCFYQQVISPSNGPRSSYVPSSSQYTLDAMQKYGFIWGVLYGCDRLMRENGDPWVYSRCFNHEGFDLKWDPVR